jgi:hypothetical protein
LIVDNKSLLQGRHAVLGGVDHQADELFIKPEIPYLEGCPKASYDTDARVALLEPSARWLGDNALAETVNGLYKTGMIRQQGPWRNLEDVEFATLTWVDWFNHRRLLGPIGNVPPAELETAYYEQLEESAMAA